MGDGRLLNSAFPGLRYVFISRTDKVRVRGGRSPKAAIRPATRRCEAPLVAGSPSRSWSARPSPATAPPRRSRPPDRHARSHALLPQLGSRACAGRLRDPRRAIVDLPSRPRTHHDASAGVCFGESPVHRRVLAVELLTISPDRDVHDVPDTCVRDVLTHHSTEREGFEPSNEVSPVTRFPVAPVQPLRHLSSARRVMRRA